MGTKAGNSPVQAKREPKQKMPWIPMILIIAVAAGFGFALDQAENGRSGDRDVSPSAPTETTAAAGLIGFKQDLRLSLSPLLTHAVAFRDELSALVASDKLPANGQPFRAWSEEFATARDLTARLIPPPGHEPVRDIAVLAVMLYREGALVASGAPNGSPERAAESIERAHRLLTVGDRTFDVARRLLDLRLGVPTETVGTPVHVPNFLDPADPETTDLPSSPAVRTIDPAHWVTEHRLEIIESFNALLSQSGEHQSESSEENALLGLANRLGAGGVPAGSAAEGTSLLRLALLTAASSSESTERTSPILRIAHQLWSLGRNLLYEAGALRNQDYQMPGPWPKHGPLWSGGRFNGDPPPLSPGDPPDKDVPGGLSIPGHAVVP